MHLVNSETAAILASVPYAAGHGASGASVAGGIIYYALASMARARVCVCLGSGGGFVPCLMRQAQLDLEIANAETYLVDAVLPEAGYGGPEEPGGWRDPEGVLARFYPRDHPAHLPDAGGRPGEFSGRTGSRSITFTSMPTIPMMPLWPIFRPTSRCSHAPVS